MRYVIRCLMRFEDEAARDKAFSYLKKRFKKTFKGEDSFVEKHLCYHDEDPPRPCWIEERVE